MLADQHELQKTSDKAIGKAAVRPSPLAARLRKTVRLGFALTAKETRPAAWTIAAMAGARHPAAFSRPARSLGVGGKLSDGGGGRPQAIIKIGHGGSVMFGSVENPLPARSGTAR